MHIVSDAILLYIYHRYMYRRDDVRREAKQMSTQRFVRQCNKNVGITIELRSRRRSVSRPVSPTQGRDY